MRRRNQNLLSFPFRPLSLSHVQGTHKQSQLWGRGNTTSEGSFGDAWSETTLILHNDIVIHLQTISGSRGRAQHSPWHFDLVMTMQPHYTS